MGAALLGLGEGIAGGIFSAVSQAAQNKWAEAQAQKQMDFQERMSSSAHQREVKDLLAAGLNPMLSVNAGESTPGGAMATGQSPGVVGMSSAVDIARLNLERAQTAADIGLKSAQARLARSNADIRAPFAGAASDAKTLMERLKDWIGGQVSIREAVPVRAESGGARWDRIAAEAVKAAKNAVPEPSSARQVKEFKNKNKPVLLPPNIFEEK